jgi:glutaredoxin
VWGGHLEHGTVVRKGAQLLVGVFAESAEATPTPTSMATPHEVDIAVLSGCPYSARAQRLLRTLGIPHRVQVVQSAEERAAIQQRSGRTTLPQVFIDGQAIGGYDALAELHGQGALEALRTF